MKKKNKSTKPTPGDKKLNKAETIRAIADAHLEQVAGGVAKPCCTRNCL